MVEIHKKMQEISDICTAGKNNITIFRNVMEDNIIQNVVVVQNILFNLE
jgi:hypothetical protein